MKRNEHLTDEELREMLMRRRIRGREARIAAYRASGRVVDPEHAPVNADFARNNGAKKPERRSSALPFRVLDALLLVVEIAAVIGIFFLLARGGSVIYTLNEEASRAFAMPTLTPTPMIRAVVLPGGHIAPDAAGNTDFNAEEIPEHLRSLVNVRSTETPAPSGEDGYIIRIGIPAIGIDAPVVQGDDWESLKSGVGLNASSGQPGKPGNIILSGHNDIFGQVFRELDRLQPGDEIVLLTEKNAYTYTVSGTEIVEPTRVDVMRQTEESTLTLISCYPYLIDTQRIVVTALLRQ